MANELKTKITDAVQAIRARSKVEIQIAIVLGTGLGNIARQIQDPVTISYEDIPHFPKATAASHAGQFIIGTLNSVPVAVMEGRFHFYEGYTPEQITLPIRVMRALGAGTLVVTNACGSLNPMHRKGDILIIDDHINLMGFNPLVGPNDDTLGPRFPDMFNAYTPEYIKQVQQIALDNGIAAHRGVYAAMTGPSLETKAEYRMLQRIGADAIGMSTVPEVIVGVHSGLKILGMAILTDLCLPDSLGPCNIEEIIAVANGSGPKLEKLLLGFVKNFAKTGQA